MVALDAKTGELKWVYSMHEGNRAAIAPRQLSGRGVSYWTDGNGDDRIIYVTPAIAWWNSMPIPAAHHEPSAITAWWI